MNSERGKGRSNGLEEDEFGVQYRHPGKNQRVESRNAPLRLD